jgi:hypothetical protein
MEPSRFDELTKALATATSRRQALKTIAATTIGSILGLSGIGTVFAKPPKCHRNGLGCDTNSQCCSGYCDPTTSKCAPPPCEGLQQPCTSASQCCDTGQGKTTCEENFENGPTVCCNTPGGSCSMGGLDCCGQTRCIGGTCQCNGTGDFCQYNTDCCSGTCNNSGPGTLGTCA